MHSIDAATIVWERDDEHFSFPVPSLLMKYWKAGPLPDYLEENRKNYDAGMAGCSARSSGCDA